MARPVVTESDLPTKALLALAEVRSAQAQLDGLRKAEAEMIRRLHEALAEAKGEGVTVPLLMGAVGLSKSRILRVIDESRDGRS